VPIRSPLSTAPLGAPEDSMMSRELSLDEQRVRSRAWPVQFGRATVLERQTPAGKTLSQLRRACTLGLTGRNVPAERYDDLLLKWQDDLSRLFSNEESEEYFGAIALAQTRLIPQIAELRADHAALLDELRRAREFMKMGHDSIQMARRALALTARFDAHERAESTLLQDFFETIDS
jgi:hypothetical protein